jgi:hypothetical protein
LSKLTIPLDGAAFTGMPSAIEANLPVWLCQSKDHIDHLGAYQKVRFRVDPGAHFTSMGIDYAREIGLELPEHLQEFISSTASGQARERFIAGRLYARIVGMESDLLEWPCFFFENRPRNVPPLLGLGGVLQSVSGQILRLSFDGTPIPGARHGTFSLEIFNPPPPTA